MLRPSHHVTVTTGRRGRYALHERLPARRAQGRGHHAANQCQQDYNDHLSIAYDSNALQVMINALGSDNPDFQPACTSVGPLIGNV